MKLSSPYPYMGGKSTIMRQVWRRFGAVDNFIDPFFGSGAALLSRPHWIPDSGWLETVNDLDGMIANFWRALADDPAAVAQYADWPSNENDLHARHAWLVGQKGRLAPALEGDPLYYDARIAGWWCWGMACWIGGGFCSGEGSWVQVDGQLVHLGNAGRGVQRQLVHLGNAGQGVQRKRVHLGNAGQGHAGTGEQGLYAWFDALSARLRRVRVCCGDWKRVVTPAVTTSHGLTAIFLDPPYSLEAGRDMSLYNHDSGTVAHEVRQWALEQGANPLLRLAVCGYDTEHTDLEAAGWSTLRWKAQGGMSHVSKGRSRGKDNAHRETIWFSPHCLRPDSPTQLELFG